MARDVEVVQAWGVREALAAFDADERPRSIRVDGRQNLRRYLRELLLHADWRVQDSRRGQMLVSVRQETLAANLGMTDRTVRRHHRRLEALGYVATVVAGSTPAFRPMALRKRLEARSKALDAVAPAEGNTVPVYAVLLPTALLHAVPGGPELLAQMIDDADQAARDEPGEALHAVETPAPDDQRRGGLHAVDDRDARALTTLFDTADQQVFTSVRPSGGFLRRKVNSSAGAGTRGKHENDPLRGQPFGHGPGGRDVLGAPRRGLWTKVQGSQIFPADRHPTTRAERLLAADELRRRVIALQRASAQSIRSTCREFFLAGWTVADLAHAVEHRPDGSQVMLGSIPWATGPGPVGDHERRGRRAAAWLAHRLAAWRDHAGTVTKSRQQRDQAEAAARAAEARAQRERAARAAAQRAETGHQPVTGTTVAAAREVARAAAARGTRSTPVAPKRPPRPVVVPATTPRRALRPVRHTSVAEAIRRAEEAAGRGHDS